MTKILLLDQTLAGHLGVPPPLALCVLCAQLLSRVRLFVILWAIL